jgi:anti-sigma B factor antagonist
MIGGELDLATAPLLAHQLRELDLSGSSRLVLDMRELSFTDCAGLAEVVAADEWARGHGATLEVLCCPGQVRRIFTLAGIDRRLTISTNGPHQTAAA